MKNLPAALLLAALLPLAHAEDPAHVAAERARLAAVRAEAHARYAEDEKACYRRFGVNDCLNEARARRTLVLSDVRRQEIVINDAERKRKGAERLRELEERSGPKKQEEAAQQRTRALDSQKQRDLRAADKAGKREAQSAQDAAATPRLPKAERKAPSGPTPAQAARNAQDYNERLEAAREHKDSVQKRVAERNKPPLKPLPVPP